MDAVAGDAQDGLGGAAEVPDAAVPGLSLQPLGGRVAGEAEGGAALLGLVQARQAPVRQPLVQGPETGGRVSGWEGEGQRRSAKVSGGAGGNAGDRETHLPSRERCRLPW